MKVKLKQLCNLYFIGVICESLRKVLQDDGSDGEKDNNQTNEEKRRIKRKRKVRLRDGLLGMMNVEHRERQRKSLAQVICDDFKQRMFMHQDKIRAVLELITKTPPSPEVSNVLLFLNVYFPPIVMLFYCLLRDSTEAEFDTC